MRSRSNFLLLIVLALFQAAFIAPAFADADAGTAQQGAAIQVHGDSVEYFHETEKVVGTGNVSIDYEGAKLTADKITVNLKDKVAVAEGNVVLTQNGSVFKGNRGEYDSCQSVYVGLRGAITRSRSAILFCFEVFSIASRKDFAT